MTERRCLVLIVEHSADDRAWLRRALAQSPDQPYDIIEADTGQLGLAHCRQQSPDCVVLDHRLPDMDALEFLAELKDGRDEPPLPVVVLVGRGDEALTVQAMKAGAHDYLLDRPSIADVFRAVRSAIERFRRTVQTKRRVLIIDDSAEDRGVYRRFLSREAGVFEFAEAETGEEGLALARTFRPDCILLDYHLPDTDGLDVLTALMHDRNAGDAPAVIMLTGQGNESVAVRALKAGAEDYLAKGPAVESLPQAVRSALERVELRRRLEEQRRELERHRNQLRVTLASIGDAVVATDRQGHVSFLNAVAEKLTGWTQNAAQGRPLDEVFVIVNEDTGAQVENPALRALREGLIVGLANHTVLVAKDGQRRPIDDSAAPIRDEAGEVYGAVLVFRDVSERRQIEQNQKRLEDELQRRLTDLALADKRKDQFLAMLAHELRNPLAPLRNAVHILRLKSDDWKTVEQVRDLLERQVGHMGRLVDDLLDVSRITQGKVTLKRERLDLARLVEQTASDHENSFLAAGIALKADVSGGPVWISGDETRLTQVLDNLLTNALKFTSNGGEVTISLHPRDAHALISVRDTGIGIAPDMLGSIFDVFAQADSTLDRSRGGLGLGLAIVKGLVEMHGGTITAQSPGLGHGTEFKILLPLDKEAASASPSRATNLAAPEKRKVLVVEDNRDAAESMKMLLTLLGFEIRLVHSGPEALEAARQWSPDAVICDIGLPGMNGFDVARSFRQLPNHAQTRLIALTGYGRDEDMTAARAAGFDDFLVKPAAPNDLVEKITGRPGGQDP